MKPLIVGKKLMSNIYVSVPHTASKWVYRDICLKIGMDTFEFVINLCLKIIEYIVRLIFTLEITTSVNLTVENDTEKLQYASKLTLEGRVNLV